MAKTFDFLSNTSGKINDDHYTRKTENGTILAHTPRKTGITRRSEKQANLRCQMANAGAVFQLFTAKKLVNAFENKGAGVNDYNAFVQVNYNKAAVFIPKDVGQAGGCVLAGYQYSRGSLPPIRLILGQTNVLVTDLALGALVIDATTTMGDFAAAVIANNSNWEPGDQLTFFYAEQYIDAEGVPRASMESYRMVLALGDQTKLWDIVAATGFTTVNGYLGMNTPLSESGASWIHSRTKADGGTQVSTQRLVVVNSILDNYRGDEAMVASAASYGGINTREEYLNPNSTLADLGMQPVSGSVPQGSGNGSGSGSGSGNSGGGNPSAGSGTTGGGTISVAAPSVSGTTPFTESTTVTMTAENGAEIRYTTDGSVPTSTSTLYSTPVTLASTTTVKAIAIKDGVSATVTSRTFTKTTGGDAGGDMN